MKEFDLTGGAQLFKLREQFIRLRRARQLDDEELLWRQLPHAPDGSQRPFHRRPVCGLIAHRPNVGYRFDINSLSALTIAEPLG